MCTRNALSQILEKYAAKDPVLMAELSGGEFKDGSIYLKYCQMLLKVTHPGGEFSLLPHKQNLSDAALTHDEKVVIAQYLLYACGLPPRGQWISFLDLKGGQLHLLPFQKEAQEPLARRYHDRLAFFLARGQGYGGTVFKQGDAGIIIPVFPRLNLAFLIWKGGEEFPPRGVVLFDSVAEAYLSTATLYVLAIQAMIRIWFPGDTRFSEGIEVEKG